MSRTQSIAQTPFLGKLDREAGALGKQLAQMVREAVKRGELKPGETMPSTRALADSLGVARGTVLEAFEQLIAEGFLEAKPGGSTKVALSLGNAPLKPRASKPLLARPMPLSSRAAGFAAVAQQFDPLPAAPFAVSVPIGDVAPDDVWRRFGNRIRAHGRGAPAGYGDPRGVQSLREAIADYARRSRSVQCEADQVIVTTGTQQGLFLSCQVLLDEGDFAWVEDPAYKGITAILETSGRAGKVVRVPVDGEGMQVEEGIRIQPDARAAFVTPSHQYPLGMPLSMSRRNALLGWAAKQSAWIVEDDYDSELRYAGHPFPSLQGLDPERVVYLGTFSKILFPSLRLGYAIVPRVLVDAYCGARSLLDRHTPSADQHVLADFMAEGHLDRHIRRIRAAYAESRAQLCDLLEQAIPAELGWLQPSDQGMHLVLWLGTGIVDTVVAAKAAKQGIGVRPVSPMYGAGRGRHGLVLGFAPFPAEQTRAAVASLALLIRQTARDASADAAYRS